MLISIETYITCNFPGGGGGKGCPTPPSGSAHENIRWIVCLFDLILTSHQQSFSYEGTGLPGLNQY